MIFITALAFLLFAAAARLGSEEPRHTVSVFYFNNNTKIADWDWLKRSVSDMLITDLSSSREIVVLEREEIDKVFKEQNFSHTDEVDDNRAIQLGKLLSADRLITGSFTVINNDIRIDAKITDTASGEIKGVKASGSSADIFTLAEDLAKSVMTALSVKIPDGMYRESHSVDAVKNYYEGEILLDIGRPGDALQKFTQSSRLDPIYAKPQKGISDAYLFLKDFRKMKFQRDIEGYYDKIDALKKRLAERPFRTYADILKTMDMSKMSDSEREAFNRKNEVYMIAQTPAQCIWHMQIALMEIYMRRLNFYDEEANRAVQELEDAGKKDESDKMRNDAPEKRKAFVASNRAILEEIVQLASSAKRMVKDDPFIQEILYFEIMGYKWLEDYAMVKSKAEDFMTRYKDYRMIDAVMNFYEESLDKLSKKK